MLAGESTADAGLTDTSPADLTGAAQQLHAETAGQRQHPQPAWKPAIEKIRQFARHPLLLPAVLFGLFYGMAMASKINIFPLALLLPAAVAIRISYAPRQDWQALALRALVYLALAGLVSLLVFRLGQPYAFSGPGFFGLKPNPAWLAQIREQRSQATPAVDMPPAMQWARRPIWFVTKADP